MLYKQKLKKIRLANKFLYLILNFIILTILRMSNIKAKNRLFKKNTKTISLRKSVYFRL